MPIFVRSYPPFLFVLLLAVVAGCDSGPGARLLEQSSPSISVLVLNPTAVNIDALPEGAVVEGIATFTLDVDVTVSDADEDLESLFLFLLRPDNPSESAAESVVPLSQNGTISSGLTVSIPVSLTGVFTLRAYASDRSGQLGNQAIGSLEVSGGSPPVIDSIDIPEVIVRPPAGEPPVEVPIVAHVSDPEGLTNILRVEVRVNEGGALLLCDDGGSGQCNPGFQSSGDVLAGDGLFTLTIQLGSTNQPGENRFVFRAIDRSGLDSQTVEKIVVVQ